MATKAFGVKVGDFSSVFHKRFWTRARASFTHIEQDILQICDVDETIFMPVIEPKTLNKDLIAPHVLHVPDVVNDRQELLNADELFTLFQRAA